MRATGQSEKANRLEAEHKSKNRGNKKDRDPCSTDCNQQGRAGEEGETFFTSFAGVKESYLTTEHPFAIVDTGAISSMIG
jgi:hypothetical protein